MLGAAGSEVRRLGMADFVTVPVGGAEGGASGQVVLFQSASSDLVALHAGRPTVGEMAADAKGRLEAIAAAAEEVYQELKQRLQPDEVQMEIAVGLSAEVGWFVAKSEASGSLKLTLAWKQDPPA